jgi:hypothetical protein
LYLLGPAPNGGEPGELYLNYFSLLPSSGPAVLGQGLLLPNQWQKGTLSPWTKENLFSITYAFACIPIRIQIGTKAKVECSTCFLRKIVEQIKPIKVYNNFKENRQKLIKDQKDKTGVYCLVNKINGNIYIGTSTNIAVRMRNYLNTTLKNKTKIKIKICLLYKHCVNMG